MIHPQLERRWVVGITQPAAFLVFATGAWLALMRFPGSFDWQRMMISELLSPKENPAGFIWIAIGIALSGLLLLPLGACLHRALTDVSRRAARSVRALVVTGGLSMTGIAVIADIPRTLPLHTVLALLVFGTLLAGLVTTAAQLVHHPEMTRLRAGRRWRLRLVLALFVVPIAAALVTQGALALTQDIGPGAPTDLPEWLNVAFWEWILAGLIYGGGWLLAWLIPERGA